MTHFMFVYQSPTHGDVLALQILSWKKVLKIMVISVASLLWIEVK